MKGSQLHARTAKNLANQSLLSNCITDESHNSVDKVEEREKNPLQGVEIRSPSPQPTHYTELFRLNSSRKETPPFVKIQTSRIPVVNEGDKIQGNLTDQNSWKL